MRGTVELNGHKLAVWQRSKRRYAIEQIYRYMPWHPTSLFATCARYAIFQFSNGVERSTAASQAVQMFTKQATFPGMDVAAGTDTYKLAMDLCSMIRTLLAYLERITLTSLTQLEPKIISLDNDLLVRWSFLANADESGMLHRWIFVDAIDDDAVIAEMHKWETFGDLVVYDAPMMLHFVAIGRMYKGRRHSPWCMAYVSPVIVGKIKFRKTSRDKNGSELSENWKPVWFADNMSNSEDVWVDQMIDENAHEPLIKHVTLNTPTDKHANDFYFDLRYEAHSILNTDLGDPMLVPMCRTACDIPYVCPHQQVCYSTSTTFANAGTYERVDKATSTRKSLEPRTTVQST